MRLASVLQVMAVAGLVGRTWWHAYAYQRLEEELYEELQRRGVPASAIPETIWGQGYDGLNSFRRPWAHRWFLDVAARTVPESRYLSTVRRTNRELGIGFLVLAMGMFLGKWLHG